jgi:hypothetical protein
MRKLKLDKIRIGNLGMNNENANKGDNRSTNTLFAVCSQVCASVRCSFEC